MIEVRFDLRVTIRLGRYGTDFNAYASRHGQVLLLTQRREMKFDK